MMPSCCRRHWMPGDMRYENSHQQHAHRCQKCDPEFSVFYVTSVPGVLSPGWEPCSAFSSSRQSVVRSVGNVNLV